MTIGAASDKDRLHKRLYEEGRVAQPGREVSG